MRFELSNSTPPHLNRRLQLRMLGFVGLIAVIMFFMMTVQSKPKPDTPLPGQPDAAVYEVNEGPSEPLRDGEFISEKWQEPPPLPERRPDNPDEDLGQELDRREAQFDKSSLRRVKDNTLGIRREEGDAYYRLLDHARHVPTEALDRAGAKDVLYINLMTQPDRFRGDPVTIHGDLWRLYEFQAGPNPYGLKTLYEAWIFSGDSSNHPYRVVFSHLPKELEPGENLRKPVKVTGYFFKREGYASGGGMHVAPTLLAKRVDLYRSPDAAPSTDAIVPYMIGVISAVGLAFLVTLVSFVISDRRAARAALLREMNAPRPSFDGIVAGPFVSVKESLRQLEDKEWQAEADAVDETYEEASTYLHARDRVQHEKTEPAEPLKPTSEELAEQRKKAVAAVQSWTSQHATKSEATPPPVVPLQSHSQDDFEQEAFSEPTTGDGHSKLAAWENEIQQFAAQRQPPSLPTVEQRIAQAELERDEQLRAEELNDRLRHERAELNQQQEELERLEREELEQESLESDHRSFNLPGRHEGPDPSPPPSDHLTIDRAEREELSDEDDSSDVEDDEDEDEGTNRRSGQQRRSSRRHRRRDR